MKTSHAPLFACLIALGGCAVGPKYAHPPEVAAAPGWIADSGEGAVETQWWTSFGDAQLSELIAQADARSPDIRVAEARLREARANRDAVNGGRLPQLSASGAATTNRLSENGQFPVTSIPGFSRDMDLYDAGFDMSWEIDLWGRKARQSQAAGARAEAAEAARRGVLVSLHAEIAQSYVDMRAAQAQLASAKDQAEAQAKIARLTRERYRAGETSRFDYERAEGQARATAARLAGLDSATHAAAYRLAVLTGKPPEAVTDSLLKPAPVPAAPDSIAMGLRSELLTRRPDVAQAERTLAATTADIGAAKADLFPRFTLIGSIGQQARDPADLDSSTSTRFQFGPSLHWPIFAGGSIRAQVRAAGARADAAAANYEKAVLTALAESEVSANHFANAADTERQAQAARSALKEALTLADQRYRAGEDNLLTMLQAQTAYAQSEEAAIDARAGRARAAIALYKALGGGWQTPPSPDVQP